MISELPWEVPLAIIENVNRRSQLVQKVVPNITQVPHRRALISLCCVSRFFNQLATPELYKTTVLHCCPGLNPDHSPSKAFSKTWPQIEFGSSIRYIQNLNFKDRECDCTCFCWHTSEDASEDEEASTKVLDNIKMSRIHDQHILAFLKRLKRDGLRTFR